MTILNTTPPPLVSDFLAEFGLFDIGASGLVVITVVMILTGKLIPYKTHQQTVEALDYFKQAHDEERALRMSLTSAVDQLAKKEAIGVKIGNTIIDQIPLHGETERGENYDTTEEGDK